MRVIYLAPPLLSPLCQYTFRTTGFCVTAPTTAVNCLTFSFVVNAVSQWGGYRILEKKLPDTDRQRRFPLGVRVYPPPEILGNGISGILRPSRLVIMSNFLTYSPSPRSAPSCIHVFTFAIAQTVIYKLNKSGLLQDSCIKYK